MNLKSQYNSLAVQDGSCLHQLTDEESCRAKQILLEMLLDFSSLCAKHELCYMLGGGTCLGAVRHHGFIPWDDDIDILMPRHSYEQLKQLLLSGVWADIYEYCFPRDKKDSPCGFMKIYRKGTRWVEMGREYTPYPKGICIDIFILDGVPSSAIMQRAKGLVADTLRAIGNCVHGAWLPESAASKALSADNPRLRFVQVVSRTAGKILSIVPHKWWVGIFDWFVADASQNRYIGLPTGRMHYCGEIFPIEVYLPTSTATFEGHEFPVPHDVPRYLTNLYTKDYMQEPPVSQRERHFLVEVKL